MRLIVFLFGLWSTVRSSPAIWNQEEFVPLSDFPNYPELWQDGLDALRSIDEEKFDDKKLNIQEDLGTSDIQQKYGKEPLLVEDMKGTLVFIHFISSKLKFS